MHQSINTADSKVDLLSPAFKSQQPHQLQQVNPILSCMQPTEILQPAEQKMIPTDIITSNLPLLTIKYAATQDNLNSSTSQKQPLNLRESLDQLSSSYIESMNRGDHQSAVAFSNESIRQLIMNQLKWNQSELEWHNTLLAARLNLSAALKSLGGVKCISVLLDAFHWCRCATLDNYNSVSESMSSNKSGFHSQVYERLLLEIAIEYSSTDITNAMAYADKCVVIIERKHYAFIRENIRKYAFRDEVLNGNVYYERNAQVDLLDARVATAAEKCLIKILIEALELLVNIQENDGQNTNAIGNLKKVLHLTKVSFREEGQVSKSESEQLSEKIKMRIEKIRDTEKKLQAQKEIRQATSQIIIQDTLEAMAEMQDDNNPLLCLESSFGGGGNSSNNDPFVRDNCIEVSDDIEEPAIPKHANELSIWNSKHNGEDLKISDERMNEKLADISAITEAANVFESTPTHGVSQYQSPFFTSGRARELRRTSSSSASNQQINQSEEQIHRMHEQEQKQSVPRVPWTLEASINKEKSLLARHFKKSPASPSSSSLRMLLSLTTGHQKHVQDVKQERQSNSSYLKSNFRFQTQESENQTMSMPKSNHKKSNSSSQSLLFTPFLMQQQQQLNGTMPLTQKLFNRIQTSTTNNNNMQPKGSSHQKSNSQNNVYLASSQLNTTTSNNSSSRHTYLKLTLNTDDTVIEHSSIVQPKVIPRKPASPTLKAAKQPQQQQQPFNQMIVISAPIPNSPSSNQNHRRLKKRRGDTHDSQQQSYQSFSHLKLFMPSFHEKKESEQQTHQTQQQQPSFALKSPKKSILNDSEIILKQQQYSNGNSCGILINILNRPRSGGVPQRNQVINSSNAEKKRIRTDSSYENKETIPSALKQSSTSLLMNLQPSQHSGAVRTLTEEAVRSIVTNMSPKANNNNNNNNNISMKNERKSIPQSNYSQSNDTVPRINFEQQINNTRHSQKSQPPHSNAILGQRVAGKQRRHTQIYPSAEIASKAILQSGVVVGSVNNNNNNNNPTQDQVEGQQNGHRRRRESQSNHRRASENSNYNFNGLSNQYQTRQQPSTSINQIGISTTNALLKVKQQGGSSSKCVGGTSSESERMSPQSLRNGNNNNNIQLQLSVQNHQHRSNFSSAVVAAMQQQQQHQSLSKMQHSKVLSQSHSKISHKSSTKQLQQQQPSQINGMTSMSSSQKVRAPQNPINKQRMQSKKQVSQQPHRLSHNIGQITSQMSICSEDELAKSIPISSVQFLPTINVIGTSARNANKQHAKDSSLMTDVEKLIRLDQAVRIIQRECKLYLLRQDVAAAASQQIRVNRKLTEQLEEESLIVSEQQLIGKSQLVSEDTDSEIEDDMKESNKDVLPGLKETCQLRAAITADFRRSSLCRIMQSQNYIQLISRLPFLPISLLSQAKSQQIEGILRLRMNVKYVQTGVTLQPQVQQQQQQQQQHQQKQNSHMNTMNPIHRNSVLQIHPYQNLASGLSGSSIAQLGGQQQISSQMSISCGSVGKKSIVEIEAKLTVMLRNLNGMSTFGDVSVRGEVCAKSEVKCCLTANELLLKIFKQKIELIKSNADADSFQVISNLLEQQSEVKIGNVKGNCQGKDAGGIKENEECEEQEEEEDSSDLEIERRRNYQQVQQAVIERKYEKQLTDESARLKFMDATEELIRIIRVMVIPVHKITGESLCFSIDVKQIENNQRRQKAFIALAQSKKAAYLQRRKFLSLIQHPIERLYRNGFIEAACFKKIEGNPFINRFHQFNSNSRNSLHVQNTQTYNSGTDLFAFQSNKYLQFPQQSFRGLQPQSSLYQQQQQQQMHLKQQQQQQSQQIEQQKGQESSNPKEEQSQQLLQEEIKEKSTKQQQQLEQQTSQQSQTNQHSQSQSGQESFHRISQICDNFTISTQLMRPPSTLPRSSIQSQLFFQSQQSLKRKSTQNLLVQSSYINPSLESLPLSHHYPHPATHQTQQQRQFLTSNSFNSTDHNPNTNTHSNYSQNPTKPSNETYLTVPHQLLGQQLTQQRPFSQFLQRYDHSRIVSSSSNNVLSTAGIVKHTFTRGPSQNEEESSRPSISVGNAFTINPAQSHLLIGGIVESSSQIEEESGEINRISQFEIPESNKQIKTRKTFKKIIKRSRNIQEQSVDYFFDWTGVDYTQQTHLQLQKQTHLSKQQHQPVYRIIRSTVNPFIDGDTLYKGLFKYLNTYIFVSISLYFDSPNPPFRKKYIANHTKLAFNFSAGIGGRGSAWNSKIEVKFKTFTRWFLNSDQIGFNYEKFRDNIGFTKAQIELICVNLTKFVHVHRTEAVILFFQELTLSKHNQNDKALFANTLLNRRKRVEAKMQQIAANSQGQLSIRLKKSTRLLQEYHKPGSLPIERTNDSEYSQSHLNQLYVAHEFSESIFRQSPDLRLLLGFNTLYSAKMFQKKVTVNSRHLSMILLNIAGEKHSSTSKKSHHNHSRNSRQLCFDPLIPQIEQQLDLAATTETASSHQIRQKSQSNTLNQQNTDKREKLIINIISRPNLLGWNSTNQHSGMLMKFTVTNNRIMDRIRNALLFKSEYIQNYLLRGIFRTTSLTLGGFRVTIATPKHPESEIDHRIFYSSCHSLTNLNTRTIQLLEYERTSTATQTSLPVPQINSRSIELNNKLNLIFLAEMDSTHALLRATYSRFHKHASLLFAKIEGIKYMVKASVYQSNKRIEQSSTNTSSKEFITYVILKLHPMAKQNTSQLKFILTFEDIQRCLSGDSYSASQYKIATNTLLVSQSSPMLTHESIITPSGLITTVSAICKKIKRVQSENYSKMGLITRIKHPVFLHKSQEALFVNRFTISKSCQAGEGVDLSRKKGVALSQRMSAVSLDLNLGLVVFKGTKIVQGQYCVVTVKFYKVLDYYSITIYFPSSARRFLTFIYDCNLREFDEKFVEITRTRAGVPESLTFFDCVHPSNYSDRRILVRTWEELTRAMKVTENERKCAIFSLNTYESVLHEGVFSRVMSMEDRSSVLFEVQFEQKAQQDLREALRSLRYMDAWKYELFFKMSFFNRVNQHNEKISLQDCVFTYYAKNPNRLREDLSKQQSQQFSSSNNRNDYLFEKINSNASLGMLQETLPSLEISQAQIAVILNYIADSIQENYSMLFKHEHQKKKVLQQWKSISMNFGVKKQVQQTHLSSASRGRNDVLLSEKIREGASSQCHNNSAEVTIFSNNLKVIESNLIVRDSRGSKAKIKTNSNFTGCVSKFILKPNAKSKNQQTCALGNPSNSSEEEFVVLLRKPLLLKPKVFLSILYKKSRSERKKRSGFVFVVQNLDDAKQVEKKYKIEEIESVVPHAMRLLEEGLIRDLGLRIFLAFKNQIIVDEFGQNSLKKLKRQYS